MGRKHGSAPRRRQHPGTLVGAALALAACASPQPPAPVEARQVVPGPRERVVVDQAYVIADVSGSVTGGGEFAEAKRQVRSFVAGMPEGSYASGGLAFGGDGRSSTALARFDRGRMGGWADGIPEYGETTPLSSALRETGNELAGRGGRAAVLVVSDGLPTSNGVRGDDAVALWSARKLAEAHGGRVCLYTVLVGDDPAGAGFMESLASATGCGGHRRATALRDAGALHDFQRAIFLGAAPAAPAAVAPGDADADGVLDDADRCPRTPLGAGVDPRGCWVIQGLNFDTNRAEIKPEFRARLDDVVAVLKRNPEVRIRVDGHTDDRGDAGYNQALSERRAGAVADHLVAKGISASRIERKGFGETAPIRPNDTPENRYRNRRTELSVID